ncbi:MAG: hypothetical protein ACP5N1_05335 [Candidatus Woesearchaeota archaeon]
MKKTTKKQASKQVNVVKTPKISKNNSTKNTSQVVPSTNTKNPKSDNSSANSSAHNSKALFQKISDQRKSAIEDVVKELVNEDAIPIVLYLIGRTKVSEFVLAQDLDLEIHKARNLLYRLLEHNILYFHRKKDKIKGWYICYWDFNEKIIPFQLEKIKSQKLQKLKERLEKESSSTFYMCKSACTRMDFEKSMEFNFKCPECGELMDEQNNLRTLEFLKERIADLDKDLKAYGK